jgi:hypothetical protein
MSIIDKIVKSINDNISNPYYSEIISSNYSEKKSMLYIFFRLGIEYEIHEIKANYIIFKRNTTYILVEYIELYLIDSKYIITMFSSIYELEKYLLN